MQFGERPEKLSLEFLLDLHRICMKTSKILPVKSSGPSEEFQIKYIPIGVTRQVSRKTVTMKGPPRVQFCPFDNVEEELKRFFHLARVRGGFFSFGYS